MENDTQKTFNPYGTYNSFNLPFCLTKFPGLSSSAKILWSILVYHAGRDGKCFPSQELLAEEMSLSRQQINNLIRELVQAKFIKINKPQGQEVLLHFNNSYSFLLHPILEILPESSVSDVKSILHQEDKPILHSNDNSVLHPNKNINNKNINNLSSKEESVKKQVSSNTSCIANIARPILMKRKETLVKSKPTPKNKVLVKQTNYAAEVKSILDYWENKGLKVPKETTETSKTNLASCKNILNGKLFDKQYSKQDILKAIENYSLAALNLKFQPMNKDFLQKQYFHQFVWNNYSTNGDRSLFQKYLETEPQLLKSFDNNLKPINPVVHKTIVDWYRHSVLGGIGGNFTAEQENQFVKGANKVTEFYKEYKHQFTSVGFTEVSLARELCEYFQKKSNTGMEIHPVYFVDKKTYETYFPQYLLQQRSIREIN